MWTYVLVALTTLGTRLLNMNPFIAFFLAVFGIAVYLLAFNLLLLIMGAGGYFFERYYDERLMDRTS